MSYKQQYIDFDIPYSQVLHGIPVGYEVTFSKNKSGNPSLYKLSTFDASTEENQGAFFYSLDNGETWVDFPIGENGMVFNSEHKIRIKANTINAGYILASRDGNIYRISSDGKKIIDVFETNEPIDSEIFEINEKNDVVCLANNRTIYRLQTKNGISPYNNSINAIDEPFDIAIDSSRESFWQINSTNICLKKFSGEVIFCENITDLGELYSIKGIGYGKIAIDFGVA